MNTPTDKVLIGYISDAHGVRGEVKIKSFAQNPKDIVAYGPVCDETGERIFALKIRASTPKGLIAQIAGITDRDQAQNLKGTQLFADRKNFPDVQEEEFYYHDLVGMSVEDENGNQVGIVDSIHDFGAGDVVEIKRVGQGSLLYPFTKQFFPEITPEKITVNIVEENDEK